MAHQSKAFRVGQMRQMLFLSKSKRWLVIVVKELVDNQPCGQSARDPLGSEHEGRGLRTFCLDGCLSMTVSNVFLILAINGKRPHPRETGPVQE